MLRRWWPLSISVMTMALFWAFGERWFAELSGGFWFAFLLLWLFAAILLETFAVVRHAVSWRSWRLGG
jgi:hypothetical protein